MKRIAILSMILNLSVFFPVTAQAAGMDMKGMAMPVTGKANQGAAIAAVGVVKQVDRDRGIAVIAHEPIKSLGWSAMTMDFRTEDKAMLGKLKQGEKVNFEFVIRGDEYVLTKVE